MSTRRSVPLVVHVIYALSTGGLENGLVNIINRMPAGRYRHAIICLTRADDFATRITVPGVEVIELHKREGHDLGCYMRLWRHLRRLRPDIVHSRNLAALETQLLALGCPRARRVHGEHGREINDLDGSNPRYLLLRRIMRHVVHSYIAVSEDLARWLVERVGVAPGRVHQIYNGVDYRRFTTERQSGQACLPAAWQAQADRLVVGTVGRLSPVKDQATLLRATARLLETAPELAPSLRLLIVGDGPQREQLEQEAVRLGLENSVWFAGNRSDVPELLQQMDVFVLPSLAEGISNTILEAQAAGLPVIATRVGGNTELVDGGVNGSLVSPADPEELARAVLELLNDRGLRHRLGNAARERVQQRFDWSRTVDAYMRVYDGLLRGKQGLLTTG